MVATSLLQELIPTVKIHNCFLLLKVEVLLMLCFTLIRLVEF